MNSTQAMNSFLTSLFQLNSYDHSAMVEGWTTVFLLSEPGVCITLFG